MKILAAVLALFWAISAGAQVSVLTESYDNSRTASNLSETVLNQSNVNVNNFGKIATIIVNGAVYAQPLYVANLSINGQTHNVLYVVTMNNAAYAFDADSGTTLWEIDYLDAVKSPTANIAGNIGIEGTPVIDGNMIYFVTYQNNSAPYYTLRAVNIASGAEIFHYIIDFADFNAQIQMQRPGLAVANGQVFGSFGSFGDQGAFHGWLVSFAETPLQMTNWVDITPTGEDGAIWMSGRAPVVDSNGNIYISTANGTYDGTNNFGDSFVKYSTNGNSFSLADWFTPDNFLQLDQNDEDLGASGLLKIPNTSLIIGGGKSAFLYLVNAQAMGHEWMGNSQIPQQFSIKQGSSFAGIFTSPAFYNNCTNPRLYLWPTNGYLSSYSFSGLLFNSTPVSQSTFTSQTSSFAGALAVTANGCNAGTGIVWVSIPLIGGEDEGGNVPGVLRAFNADDLTKELWDSNMNSARDAAGLWSKFRTPLIVNGKAYQVGLPTDFFSTGTGTVSIYGLLNTTLPAPMGLIASIQ